MKRLIVPWVPWLCYLLVAAIDSGCSQDLCLGADVDQDVAVALALAAAARQAPKPPQAPEIPDDPFVAPVKPDVDPYYAAPPVAPAGYQWVKPLDRPHEWYLYHGSLMVGGWNEETGEYRDYTMYGDRWGPVTVPPWQRPAQAAGISLVPARQAPAPVAYVAQQPAMRSPRVLVERGNVVCST